jgi:hypothetical protein
VVREPIQPLKCHLGTGSGNGGKLWFREGAPSASDAKVLYVHHRIHARAEVSSEFRETVFDALNAGIIVVQRIEGWVSSPIKDPVSKMAMGSSEARPRGS